MEIATQTLDGRHRMQLRGRLDASWADYVAHAIESAVRAGQHHIDLHCGAVDYISSAGIRVLLKYYKQLHAVRGALRVVEPAGPVLAVLELAGIASMLVGVPETAATRESAAAPARRWERNGVDFESHATPGGTPLTGVLHGRPERLTAGTLSAADAQPLSFGPGTAGLGLGALGADPLECAGRFGEFLAVGGVAVVQPTDGSRMPDFMVTEGGLVPSVNLLYGVTLAGGFSSLLRFEAAGQAGRVIPFSEVIETALDDLGVAAAGFVIAAESAVIVGATLAKSPAFAAGKSPLQFPGVRDWLAFTTERSTERNRVLIVGVAVREASTDAAPFLRPFGSGTSAVGHFHAAVSPYRPLPKGNVRLEATVTSLLANESAQSVLHLMADEERPGGVGQTELMRGACWAGPLASLDRSPRELTPDSQSPPS